MKRFQLTKCAASVATVCDVSHFVPRFPNSSKNMLALKVNGPIEREAVSTNRKSRPEILHWRCVALFCQPPDGRFSLFRCGGWILGGCFHFRSAAVSRGYKRSRWSAPFLHFDRYPRISDRFSRVSIRFLDRSSRYSAWFLLWFCKRFRFLSRLISILTRRLGAM